MMCYKDITWCCHSDECGNTSCFRKLKEEDYKKAKELNLPFCYGDMKTENCGYKEVHIDEIIIDN